MDKQQLKQTIDDNITTNGQNEITGAKLNDVLNEMVDSLGVVNEISVGATTTGAAGTNASVTNSGTATNPVLNFTIPRGADGQDGQDGQDGADAVNPFKGWWPDLATLKAAITAEPGDSAYVKDASPATTWSIYVYDATASSDNYWADSGTDADTSNVQTFASGEGVNETFIDDTHLANPKDGALPAVEDVMQLKAKLEGVTASESKATTTSTGTVGNYIKPNNTEGTGSGWQWGVFNVVGCKSVRFLALNYKSSIIPQSGWLFLDDENNIKESAIYNNTAESTTIEELVIPVPEGATKFKTNIAGNALTDNFYCYLQSGESVSESIDNLASVLGDVVVTPVYEDLIMTQWTSDRGIRVSDGGSFMSNGNSAQLSSAIKVSSYRGKYLVYSRPRSSSSADIGMAFYTGTGMSTYISGESFSIGDASSLGESKILVPSNASYVRFSCPTSLTSSFYAKVHIADHYEFSSGLGLIVDNLSDRVLALETGKISKEKTDFLVNVVSVNLFDSDNVSDGYIKNDSVSTSSSYKRTNGIWLEGGVEYKTPSDDGGLGGNAVYVARFDDDGNITNYLSGTITNHYLYFTPSTSGWYGFNVGRNAYLSSFMVCKTSDYPEQYTPYYNYWTFPELVVNASNLNGQFNENPLKAKTVVFDGDSICYASRDSELGGYAGRIGNTNNMVWHNCSVSGATIATGTTYEGSNRHWVSAYIDTIIANYPNLDYLILEGGTNDADLLSNDKIGTISDNYNGTYDTTTFYGAMETLMFKAVSAYPKAKIGFIVAMKMGTGNSFNRRNQFFGYAKEVCDKWGVRFLDLWNVCQMNPYLTAYYDSSMSAAENLAAGKSYADGQHPNRIGYDIITPIIENWMKNL